MTGSRLRRALLVSLGVLTALLPACGAIQENIRPVCRYGSPTVLMAQSVPAAALIPCVQALPAGWHFHSFEATSGAARFWLDSDEEGRRALTVELASSCDTSGARPTKSDEPRTRRYERIDRQSPSFSGEWLYEFTGGCVTYRFTFSQSQPGPALSALQQGLSFLPRTAIERAFHEEVGPTLDPPRAGA
jgi:hypothetical protein